MSDEPCDCASTDNDQPQAVGGTAVAPTDRWIDGPSPAREPLPDAVATALARSLGANRDDDTGEGPETDAIDTLADYAAALRDATGGGPLAVEELCHVDEPSAHWGETSGGERYDFRCFYDAVVLARLVDEAVEIHSVSPGGTEIDVEAGPDGSVTASPADAVMSFGVARDVEAPGEGGPDPETVAAATCPYVRAFPSREAYRAWAAAVPAETVGLSLDAGADLVELLAE